MWSMNHTLRITNLSHWQSSQSSFQGSQGMENWGPRNTIGNISKSGIIILSTLEKVKEV
jgi:hypothetical protein